MHNRAPTPTTPQQRQSDFQRSSADLFQRRVWKQKFHLACTSFLSIFWSCLSKEKGKKKKKVAFDLRITNRKLSQHCFFREGDRISNERWDDSTCHIPPIHQIHRRSRRHGHRRSAAGCTLCCCSEMSCHHKCCWVLKQKKPNKWVLKKTHAFSKPSNTCDKVTDSF